MRRRRLRTGGIAGLFSGSAGLGRWLPGLYYSARGRCRSETERLEALEVVGEVKWHRLAILKRDMTSQSR